MPACTTSHRDVRGAHTRCSSPRSTSTARRRHACAAITQSRAGRGRAHRRRRSQRGRRSRRSGSASARRSARWLSACDLELVADVRGPRAGSCSGVRAHPPICTQLTRARRDGERPRVGRSPASRASPARRRARRVALEVGDRDPLRRARERLAVGEPPLARRARARRSRSPTRSGPDAGLNCRVCDGDDPPDVGVHLYRDARLAHRLIVHRR